MTLIIDMGGVLMQHNTPECIRRFSLFMGEEAMNQVLGLLPNGEGVRGALMDQYEAGMVSTDQFLNTILQYCSPQTTRQDLIDAWNCMHAGIPEDRLELLRKWHQEGKKMILLSNNNELRWQDVFDKYDMSVFSYCFSSHIVHSIKPDRGIFEAAMQYMTANGFEPPYLFVDDLAENRHTGDTFGWITFPDLYSLNEYLSANG